ncbi:MAG: asparagine synthase (glutamine-hydrolyzing) [Actinomycetota bacterium]
MCGIVGFVNTRPNAQARQLLCLMSDSLVHRGPDDVGYYLSDESITSGSQAPRKASKQVGLAMRRLSVIDLATGHQPIANEDNSAWIVFNGEIYNHQELRRDLEARGHRFRTHSDTEAILHAYEEYGVDCVLHLRGMFGFAIWDERREQLFIARDHVGIKPLYWTLAGDRLLFGSEIKSLLVDPTVPRRVDREALHHYLTYLYVPAPLSMFEGIRQLPPGHRLLWRGGELTAEEYWAGPAAMLDDAAVEPVTAAQTWDVLRESVEAHLISDVPLGAFLSGGIDSTIIVALMAELSSKPVETFSVGFEAAGLYDERPFAAAVARHFGARHHEFAINQDAAQMLPEILRHLDEPLADASVIPNYLVAQLARKHVTVSLSGAGGDELFGGYRRYFGDQMAQRWQRVPGAIRRNVLLPALRMVPAAGDTALGDTSRLVQKFLEPLDLAPEQRYLAWNAFFTESAKQDLCVGGAGSPDSAQVMLPHFGRVRHRAFADRAMYVDLKSYLPGDPLFLSDRMTMASSLEARVPFVDTRVMEFAARIPVSQKIQGRKTKIILREALAGKVPDEIISRPKRGFGTPIDVWLRGELAYLVEKVLSPESLKERGYFRPGYVEWLLAQQRSGKRDFSQHIWALLVFELWHRIYIDQNLGTQTGLTFEDLGLSLERDKGARPALRPQSAVAPTEPADAQRPSHPAVPKSGDAGRSLRILMAADVDPVHVIGGAERMLNEHSIRLAQRGHQVVVLTRREDRDLPLEEMHQGVRVVRHPVAEGNPVAFMQSVVREGGKAFQRLALEQQFDLLNVHQPLEAAAVLQQAASHGLPVVYTYLSPWSDEYRVRFKRRIRGRTGVTAMAMGAWMQMNSGLRARMERNALRRSDAVMVLSEYSASQIRDLHGLSTQHAAVIPGGVNCDRFKPLTDRLETRARLGLPSGLLLLTVRNLVPRMGLDALITAMRSVVDTRPDARLVIAGTGMLRESLEEQVHSLGLTENVRFAGYVPEDRLADYYGAADLFVLPTRMLEGFGLVTIEALACGTPVLGTPIGGTQEILRRFDSTFLASGVEAEDLAEGITRQIRALEGDPRLRERCREFARETYDWDVLIPQVEELMERVVASRRSS